MDNTWKQQLSDIHDLTALCSWLVASRRRWQLAEAEFYLQLYYCESTESCLKIVSEAGATWDQFLREQALVDVARYRGFTRALEAIGEAKCLEYGVAAAIESLRVDESKLPRYAEFVADYKVNHGGVAPAKDTARDFANRANERIPTPRATAAKHALTAREDELQKQLDAALAECSKLRKQLKAEKKETKRLASLVEKLKLLTADAAE